jgi:hypothetical protein
VVTEAMYLLGFSPEAQDALWRLLERDAVKILPLDAADAPRMRELMRKYRDLPMDLADAALVRVAERERISRVFTIDRRDFELLSATGSPPFHDPAGRHFPDVVRERRNRPDPFICASRRFPITRGHLGR